MDTAQDAELQAWADNNLASDLAKKIEAKHEGMAEQTHYQFLEVDERASAMEIKAAYQNMARAFIPKSLAKAGINDMDLQYKAGTIFSRLKLVQQILTDSNKRAEYDHSLQQKAFSQSEAPASSAEKVSMHKLKADDYLKKPFDSDVLLFKIKAILKRNKLSSVIDSEETEFNFSSFYFNSKLRHLKYKDESPVKLSPKENMLLKLLLIHINDLMPRELALTRIWHDDNYFTSRSMDVYIAKLRKQLQKDSKVSINNIHGEGFRLIVE